MYMYCILNWINNAKMCSIATAYFPQKLTVSNNLSYMTKAFLFSTGVWSVNAIYLYSVYSYHR